MKKLLDARGLSCPHPVLIVQRQLRKMRSGVIEVVVDTGTSRDNVVRTGERAGWRVKVLDVRAAKGRDLEEGDYLVILTKT